MSHKYRAAIGRESPGPASRGIFAYPKPRRRNCLWQFRLPRDGKRKKQFLHTFVCLQKYVVAWHQAKGSRRLIGRHTCVRVCGAITCRTKHTGAAPQCLLAKAPKGTKSAFVPRHQTDDAVTGGDVSRIARNSHRKRRVALSVFDGADSVGRKSVSPHAGEGRKAGVYVDIKLKIKHRNLCKEISVPYLYL